MTQENKLYNIFGKYKFQFRGDSSIIIRVTKETKDRIYGVVTNIRGNQRLKDYKREFDGNPITIIKSNVSGWEELTY